VRYAMIGLHLEPLVIGSRLEGAPPPDLKGGAAFDDLVFVRMPRMDLKSNQPTNIFPTGTYPEFSCQVTGLTAGAPSVKFFLQDLDGKQIASEELPLKLEEAGAAGSNEDANSFRG